MEGIFTKAWGHEVFWACEKDYYGKTLIIKNGENTETCFHKNTIKTIFVLQGIAEITVEGISKMLQEGDGYKVRQNVRYSIKAIQGDLTVLESGNGWKDDVVVV